jgi:lipoate-protein ligase A
MRNWRFIDSGLADGATNMAIDEAILHAVSENKAPPTIRFYGWQPAALSLGYFQSVHKSTNIDALRARGFDLVRRPTGGRAVFHQHELTYSIIVPESDPDIPRTVNEAYRVLSFGLLYGFRTLGLQAELMNLYKKVEYADGQDYRSSACFDAPSWYELVVEGRKVAGSAQTRKKGVLLQHGSILLELDIDLLLELLGVTEHDAFQRSKQKLLASAVSINHLLRAKGRGPCTVDELKQPFREGLARGLDLQLYDDRLSVYEQELVAFYADSKYRSEQWTFRK